MTTSEITEPEGVQHRDRILAAEAPPRLAFEGRRRGWLLRRALVAADVLGITLAFALSGVLFPPSAQDAVHPGVETALFLLTLPAWIFAAKLYGLYDRDEERTDHSTGDDFISVFHLVTVGTWLLYAFARFTGLAVPDLTRLFFLWGMAITLVTAFRATARALCRRHRSYIQNTIIVGAGDMGRQVAEKVRRHPEYGMNLVGFVDRQSGGNGATLAGLPLLGPPERLSALVRSLGIERIVIAISGGSERQLDRLLRDLKSLDVHIDIVPNPFERIGPSATVHSIEGMTLLALPRMRISRSSLVVKRVVDAALAAVGLIVFLPLLALVALGVRLDSRGPIFYRHERLGRRGRPISVVKFRTMRLEFCRGPDYGGDSAEEAFASLLRSPGRTTEFEDNYKLADDPRATRFGRFLRRSSLDELPQLWNVLKGDMSLVGPRAITEDELPRYGEFAEDLLSIRPGLTGYWQINGRSRLAYHDRVRLDLAYIGGWSLKLDVAILARTFRALLPSRGAG